MLNIAPSQKPTQKHQGYTQLDDEAMAVMTARLAHHKGSRSALARELDMSRSAISQALDLKYPGDTKKLRARIFERLAAMINCPHLGVELAPALCASHRSRPLSAASYSRQAVQHWQACQSCLFNPDRKTQMDKLDDGSREADHV
jgi:Bacterial regulatory protein, Fis family